MQRPLCLAPGPGGVPAGPSWLRCRALALRRVREAGPAAWGSPSIEVGWRPVASRPPRHGFPDLLVVFHLSFVRAAWLSVKRLLPERDRADVADRHMEGSDEDVSGSVGSADQV